MKVVEKYYTVQEICLLLGLSDRYVRQQIHDGGFGPTDAILLVDRSLRVPASAVNEFLRGHKLRPEPGVAARTPAELKRKVQTLGEEKNGD